LNDPSLGQEISVYTKYPRRFAGDQETARIYFAIKLTVHLSTS